MQCANLRTDCTHGNPIVGARAWKYEHQLHMQRVKSVVSSVDNSKPFMGHIEEQQKRPRKSYQVRSKEKMQAHENFKMLTTIAATMNRPCSVGPRPFTAHSLNIGVRRREHWKILRENQALLERLEKSKPLVATVTQDRRDFAEHEKRVLNCSYSSRRKGKAIPASALPVRPSAGKRPTTTGPRRHEVTISCYKVGGLPHDTTTVPAYPALPPSHSPVAGRKQFDYRWKEFRCYPASRQMWAPPKTFGPKDLPKPIHVSPAA